MNDVLKQVEEALVMHRLHLKHGNVTYMGKAYDTERAEQLEAREYVMSDKTDAALTALRGLEWRPIAEMEESHFSTGDWLGWYNSAGWQVHVTKYTSSVKLFANAGYTHFYRPILPTPPKREGE